MSFLVYNIANNFVFIIQTLSYKNTSPIHKFILQGATYHTMEPTKRCVSGKEDPHWSQTLTPSYAQILNA